MKEDEIIALLQEQNSFLLEQLQETERQIGVLLEENSSLKKLLEDNKRRRKTKAHHKGANEDK